jgi:hypothetical protein
LSADGENWLDGVLGAAWALGLDAPLLLAPPPLAGKLCPVENTLAAGLAELLCWAESSASSACSALEVPDAIGLITTISSARRDPHDLGGAV